MLHWSCFWDLWGSGPDPLLRLKSFKVKSTCLARWALAQTSQGAFPGQGPLEPQPCYLCMCLASR